MPARDFDVSWYLLFKVSSDNFFFSSLLRLQPNVEGQSCAACKAGSYNLEPTNPDGCTDCFCFGTTAQCSSSYWAKTDVPVTADLDNPWTLGTARVSR